ncbi:MAG TPA: energy transducer TonB [Verrucomicrobiota bacterium]|nr:energy transducer TonB [Verrucomicrobiota bacterium]
MRRVYTPPSRRSGPLWPLGVALLLSLAVFLVLPLTQMMSSGLQKKLTLSKADTATLAAPVNDFEPPPPPPPEEKKETPPPQLSDAPPPMNLNIDLDIAVGAGGAMAGFGQFASGDEGGGLMDAFSMADLEKKPELVASVSPQYPSELRKAKIEGSVTIVFVLDETGRVEDPRVENASRPEFEKPALDAVKKWKFKPGQKDGNAVRTYMRVPIRFRIAA